jgi:cytochrome c oxidase subunit II
MRQPNALWVLPLAAVAWVAAGSVAGEHPVAPLPRPAATAGQLAEGRTLFLKLQCVKCHSGQADGRAPNLEGLWGTEVALGDGKTVMVNEEYVRESILNPRAKMVKGWQPLMPHYDGRVKAEEMAALVTYISRLKPGDVPRPGDGAPGPIDPPTDPPKK